VAVPPWLPAWLEIYYIMCKYTCKFLTRTMTTVCIITGQCPADSVIERSKSGGEYRGVERDAKVNIECYGDCPQEGTDT